MLPRLPATCSTLRSEWSAFTVARTTLCGFGSRHFVRCRGCLRLDDGADRAPGDDARSLRGGLEEDPAAAEVAEGLVRDGHAVERDAEDVLARLVISLRMASGTSFALPRPTLRFASSPTTTSVLNKLSATALHDLATRLAMTRS